MVTVMTRELSWDEGRWTHEPVSTRVTTGGESAGGESPGGASTGAGASGQARSFVSGQAGSLVVEPEKGADLWRVTSYGFVRDDAPALLADLPDGSAMEVDLVLGGSEQFDQAGILVRADAERWIKAGVEFADGSLQVGAVVTNGVSDWSTGQVPSWVGRRIGVRVSRSGDALTVRARVEDEPWRLVRLAPIDPSATWQAGPYCCAPSRAGLEVEFLAWRFGDADGALH